MTDQNMEIWKAGYDIHERYGDGPKDEAGWIRLTEDCRDLYNRFGKADFAYHMALMLVEHFQAIYKKRSGADPAEQIKMAGCDVSGH